MWGKGSLYYGAQAYFVSTDNVRNELSKIYYELKETQAISRFFRDNKKEIPYNCTESLISTLKASSFVLTDRSDLRWL